MQQPFNDSLGILEGQAKDSAGILSRTRPTPGKPEEEEAAFSDSLGILGAPTERKLDVQPAMPEESQFKDSLGILGNVQSTEDQRRYPNSETYPASPGESPFPAMPSAPGVPLPQQIGQRTAADVSRVDALTAQRQALDEAERRKAALTYETYGKGQAARGMPLEAPREAPGGDFLGTLLAEQAPPRTEYQREIGGIEANPWTDPSQTAAAGFAAGMKFALSRGAKALPAIGRGIASALPSAAMEYPIGATVDAMAENNPELAFLAAVGLGLTSGLTVENLAERGLLKLTRNIAAKYPEKAKAILPDDVLARFKARPTAETAPLESPEVDIAAQRIERRRAAAAARAQAPEVEEIPFSRSGGQVENIITTPAAEGKLYNDSLGILNPPKESAVVWGPENLETARGQAWLGEKQAQERRRGAANRTDSFRTWVAMTGGINPNDPSYRGEIRDITRGATRGMGYPPGFLNNKARSLDDRTLEAIENGWLPKGATEDDFMDAVQRNAKKRLADIGVEEQAIKEDTARLKGEQEWIVPPPLEKGEAVYTIDMKKVDEAWKPNKTFYVGKGGEGEIAGRLKGVEDWMAEGKALEMPQIHVNDYGNVTFVDGRHRFAYLRDIGHDTLPVVMDKRSAKNAQKAGMVVQEGTMLYTHPSTITGPLGGIMAGVSVDENGDISIDPKKALYGALAGVAGGAAIPKARSLARSIATTWDRKVAEPFIDYVKATTNGLITNEGLRHGLGLGRSQKFATMLREFRRDTETLWNDALKLGQELQQIAPTAAEQKRLLQVMRGSMTGNAEMQQKGEQVRKIFEELRTNLEDHQLLEYSRFDKITRAERATIRKRLAGADPLTLDQRGLIARAEELGIELKQPSNRDASVKHIQAAIAFEKERLDNYYHYASAQAYTPKYYGGKEGLTPKQRESLETELNRLKVQSRRGHPEGDPKLEEQIAEMEMMLGKGAEARRELKSTRQGLVRSYAHQRLDLPPQVEKLLEPIETAPYPASKAMGVQTSDLRKAKLYEAIADEPTWTIKPGKGVKIPANYEIVQNEAFGALHGMAVRKDILSDLNEIEETRTWFVRNWDKMMSLYRTGKAVWNPATQSRNFISNVILAYLGDVNPTDIGTYTKAFKAIRAGEANPYFKEAKEWGLYNSSFVSNDIAKLRDEFSALRDPSAVKNWVRKAIALPSQAYESSEKLFKTAVFIKARESGLSVEQAAEKAQKYLFDYSATSLPPWARHMRRWVSPFFTWTYRSTGLFADTVIRKPWKIAAIGGAMYGMEEVAKSALGLSDEQQEKERKLLPEWMKTKIPPVIGRPAYVLMPFKNVYGDNLYLDLQFILPYAGLSETWGQSPIPFADLFPNSPLFNIASAIATNRQSFTGREVYNQVLDSTAEIAAKYFDLAWKELTPSLMVGGYGYNKLATAVKNQFSDKQILDWSGKPQDMQTAILSTIFGLKLTPANMQKLRQMEVGKMHEISKAVSDEIGRLRRDKEKNKISAEEFKTEMQKLMELKKKLIMERR
jgi:hypothetical protein